MQVLLQQFTTCLCFQSEWQEHFLARCMWTVIINLLDSSFAEILTYCHLFETSLMTFISFSRKMHRLIAHVKQQLLRRDTAECTASDVWPPKRPDLNSFDHRIWTVKQERV